MAEDVKSGHPKEHHLQHSSTEENRECVADVGFTLVNVEIHIEAVEVDSQPAQRGHLWRNEEALEFFQAGKVREISFVDPDVQDDMLYRAGVARCGNDIPCPADRIKAIRRRREVEEERDLQCPEVR